MEIKKTANTVLMFPYKLDCVFFSAPLCLRCDENKKIIFFFNCTVILQINKLLCNHRRKSFGRQIAALTLLGFQCQSSLSMNCRLSAVATNGRRQ